MPLEPMYIAPARFDDPAQALEQVRDIYRRSVQHLRDAGVTYVVVDRSWLTPDAQGWMRDWSAELQPVFEGRDHVIYELHR